MLSVDTGIVQQGLIDMQERSQSAVIVILSHL